MKKTMRKVPTMRKPSVPQPVDTIELCKDLVRMAGFLEDRRGQEKIYKAVRQLQILDKLAAEAGLLQTNGQPLGYEQ